MNNSRYNKWNRTENRPSLAALENSLEDAFGFDSPTAIIVVIAIAVMIAIKSISGSILWGVGIGFLVLFVLGYFPWQAKNNDKLEMIYAIKNERRAIKKAEKDEIKANAKVNYRNELRRIMNEK